MQDDSGAPRTRTVMLSRVAPPDASGRRALAISCGVIAALVAGFAALCSGLNLLVPLLVAPGWTVASLVMAVGLGLPHVALLLWLDRNEQEPWWLLASAWLWGAVVATGLSLVGNTAFGLVALELVGDEAIAGQLTASLSAPPVEEITKGAALAVLYLLFRRHFDNVLDGIIYGALVGMGFAMMENLVYYTSPVLAGSETAAWEWAELVVLRGILTGVGTHWCFTALTGAGFGLLRVQRSGCLRWAAPLLGLGLAIGAHFGWNTFTGLFVVDPDDTVRTFLVSIPTAVAVLQGPFVVLVLGVVVLVLWHEGALIRRYLGEEPDEVVHRADIDRLIPARRRFAHTSLLLLRGRLSDWMAQRRRNRLLVELAFERWHKDQEEQRGHEDEAGRHARRVLAIRRALREVPAVG